MVTAEVQEARADDALLPVATYASLHATAMPALLHQTAHVFSL